MRRRPICSIALNSWMQWYKCKGIDSCISIWHDWSRYCDLCQCIYNILSQEEYEVTPDDKRKNFGNRLITKYVSSQVSLLRDQTFFIHICSSSLAHYGLKHALEFMILFSLFTVCRTFWKVILRCANTTWSPMPLKISSVTAKGQLHELSWVFAHAFLHPLNIVSFVFPC